MVDGATEPAINQAFWQGVRVAIRRAVIAVVGILGLYGAAASTDAAAYACGIGVFIVGCLLLFLEIKRHFDGLPPLGLGDLLIDDFNTLWVGLPLLGLFGIACLFVAARAEGGAGYYAGIGGAIGAFLVGLGSIGACFDRTETH
ncbi:hypothetical protein GCM10011611_31990 [Aliidongia dinghuensis]|uniref:Uncharacterized protein n=1 Tax=Aliidongia dinghuensis TaxID=1867774 RepID=A0A8J2YVG2_9PROT|nr:hypothetical protein [Aliidongia dinghuensis]GGF23490.1 hypothetical protein GCM10011611_31990 [Aliidongia dinghuensis]